MDPGFVQRLQDVLLEGLDLGREVFDHRQVVVDDEVDHRVEHVVLAVAELLGRRLGALAHLGVGGGGAMADRDA